MVNSVDPATVAGRFGFDWKEGSDAALTGLARDGAIVDEGWASEQGLTVGEAFSVTSAKGQKLDLEVAAIESSPILDAISMGPITVSQATFETAFGSDRNFLTFVSATDDAAVDRALAAFPDVKGQTTGEYVDAMTADIDSLLAIFYVLLALAVIVSLFGIVNTLVLSTFERTRELGMLRAVGMTRRQVRRMVRQEAVITALLGAGLGITAGLGLAAALTSALADEGLTFAVPVGALVVLAIVAGLAGVLAAVLPARRASRLNVLDALAYE
jgi:putative ABC transport system permease protein